MYERFTDRGRMVMQLANQESQRFNQEYIGTEHILLALIKEGSGVAATVLKNLDVDLRKVRLEVEKIVQSGPEMVKMGKLPQTPRAKKVIEFAIEEARNLQHNYVGTEHLLLGLLREEEGVAAQVLMNLGVKLEDARAEVLNLLGAEKSLQHAPRLVTRTLDAYGRDLTTLARQNKLDPVVGREDEIQRVLQVLGRRTRNNPLLVGEPGVGKTALIHELARWIAAEIDIRRTPFRRVVMVDCSWCAAGADDYENFRNKMAAIVDEVRMAKDLLLVLDDLQRWDYSPYAVAPLTAALTRGTIQCLAAALGPIEPKPPGSCEQLPCFEPVRVEPLSRAATLPVLAALRDRYAEHHHVEIADEAIQAIAELSGDAEGRRLPGVAVDVLDEACARVRLQAGPPPDAPALAELDERIARLTREKEEAVFVQDFEKAAACFAEIDALKQERERRTHERAALAVGVVDAAVVAEVVRQRRGSF